MLIGAFCPHPKYQNFDDPMLAIVAHYRLHWVFGLLRMVLSYQKNPPEERGTRHI
jgi:hypothetical protein